MSLFSRRGVGVFLYCNLVGFSAMLFAQSQQVSSEIDSQDIAGVVLQDGVVSYPAEFFRRYQSNTALDMVNRVPGFTLDDGGDKRGFGGAAGNILINDRRPSTKQDLPSAILARIAAERVERIELIRVRVRDIDLQGQTAVVNVVLLDDAPASVQWRFYNRHNMKKGSTPFGSISLIDQVRGIDYRIGADASYRVFTDPGVISTYNADGILTEIRTDNDKGTGPDLNGYLNASSWLGQTFFNLNSRINKEDRDIILNSTRISQLSGGQTREDIITTLRRNKRFSLGLDAERVLQPDLLGKAIFVYSLLDQNPSLSQQSLNAAGQQTRLQLQKDETTNEETIARLEFDWAGFENHAIQADLEFALNVLDNTQVFTDDTGTGPVIIDVPNANVRVEEERWNFQLQDSWSLGNFDLDYGLGFERSTISQTGDTNLERSFKFLKPRTVLTYSPTRGQQTRILIEREVSQLNFNDFVSAAVFEDNSVILGNPDLRPDSTWITEFSHEHRFGSVGVIKITAFHNWITDVLDRIPLGPTADAPGNIGDGRRWGLILETTVPLDWTGLQAAQMDFKARWQDSTVVDPVTGLNRLLSGEGGFRGDVLFRNENKYAFDMDYRQDFEAARFSWGWGLAKRARRVVYRVNEHDIFSEGLDLTAFVETKRWLGLNMRLEGLNMLDSTQYRDRLVYVGGRTLSDVQRRELREGTNGVRVQLSVSGTFSL